VLKASPSAGGAANEAVGRSKLRLAVGMDFDGDKRYEGKPATRKGLLEPEGDCCVAVSWLPR
jgi:hypothetical protein